MASVNLSLTEDCRLLTYHVTAPINPELTGDEADENQTQNLIAVEIYNNGVLASTTEAAILNFNNGDLYTNTFTVSVPDVIGTDPGIITVLVKDALGNTDSSAILSSCELDCCLAQKVLELTKCEDCSSKCSDKLVIAQKLFLYMESIRTLLSQLGSDININQGIISQALDTYNAAKAICAGNCGCNC
jgi:hypothetical protein